MMSEVIPDYILLFAEVLVFLTLAVCVFKVEKFVSVFIVVLLVYCIFGQIGYAYYPEISESIMALFGESILYQSVIFIITSVAFFAVIVIFFWKRFQFYLPYNLVLMKAKGNSGVFLFYSLYSAAFMYLSAYFIVHHDDISWYSAQSVEIGVGYKIFIFLFKEFVPLIIILFAKIAESRRLAFRQSFPLICSIALFAIISFKLGNRTDPVALFMGLFIYTFYRFNIKLSPKNIGIIFVLAFLFYSGLGIVEHYRYQGDIKNDGMLRSLLFKDYYAPVHILFAVIELNYINPLEVLFSNGANALFMLDYPLLQNPVTDIFNPGVASRSTGYGFYILTEGYIFSGHIGFLYNGIVIFIFLSLWRKIASSNSEEFNFFIVGLIGSLLVNIVRGQTSYFIKYSIVYFLPAIFMYLLVSTKTLKIRIKKVV